MWWRPKKTESSEKKSEQVLKIAPDLSHLITLRLVSSFILATQKKQQKLVRLINIRKYISIILYFSVAHLFHQHIFTSLTIVSWLNISLYQYCTMRMKKNKPMQTLWNYPQMLMLMLLTIQTALTKTLFSLVGFHFRC